MSASEYPVDLTAPDIGPYRRGNAGVDYVTTFDSGAAGPHVLVTAVVHGNELCGAIALDFLFRRNVRPRRGRLTLAFANVDAYASFDPQRPSASRFVDEDFNRVWSPEVLDGPRQSVELKRARALRPIVDQADVLLDIHSMQHPTTPLMMCGPLDKGRRLALAVGAAGTIVSDGGHAAGRRMRDYDGFGDPASPKNALLIECGQHWARSSADVARDTLIRFLAHLDAIDAGGLQDQLLPPAPRSRRVVEVTQAVTIRSDGFTFAAPYVGLEVIPNAGTVIGHDGADPVVTPYDDCVLIMPSRRLTKGQTAVRLGRYA